jgi:hypothetical protein
MEKVWKSRRRSGGPLQREGRFSDFAKSIGGERVSEVIRDGPCNVRLPNFLLSDRTVVAELKTVTADYLVDPAIGAKYEALFKRLSAKGRPPRVSSTMTS